MFHKEKGHTSSNGLNNNITDDASASKLKHRQSNKVIRFSIMIPIGIVLVIIALIVIRKTNHSSSNDQITGTPKNKIVAITPTPTQRPNETVFIGEYMQDDSSEPQPIEWIILKTVDSKALVISKAVIDCKAFDDSDPGATWEKSSLRQWLNNVFYNNTFSDEEKEFIVLTKNVNAGTYAGQNASEEWLVTNDESNMAKVLSQQPGCPDTDDYVFLLSIDEATALLPSKTDRAGNLSEYAFGSFLDSCRSQAYDLGIYDDEYIVAQILDAEDLYGHRFCSWWLRSSGSVPNCTAVVDYYGDAWQLQETNDSSGGVRPAMWIDLYSFLN